MRYVCVLAALCLTGAVWAQEKGRRISTYSYDVNGRRVIQESASARSTQGQTTRTEWAETLNGRREPLESVEERVIEEGPSGRVVERIIRRHGQNGQPGQVEKVRIEERAQPGGGKVVSESVYRTDINGRFALQERRTTEATVSGAVTNVSASLERPNLSGSMETVERRRAMERKRTDGFTRDVSTFRKDASGNFVEQERERTEMSKRGKRETETTTVYNAARGSLQFATQTVTDTERSADGSETREISIYGTSAMGRSVVGSGEAVLREQRLVERTPGSGGSMVERLSVRRASLADANRMEPYRVVSEAVCTGNCVEAPAEKTAEETAEVQTPEQEQSPVQEQAELEQTSAQVQPPVQQEPIEEEEPVEDEEEQPGPDQEP